MGKILDYIVKKGEGNYLCYKTKQLKKDYRVLKAVRKLLELGYKRFSSP